MNFDIWHLLKHDIAVKTLYHSCNKRLHFSKIKTSLKQADIWQKLLSNNRQSKWPLETTQILRLERSLLSCFILHMTLLRYMNLIAWQIPKFYAIVTITNKTRWLLKEISELGWDFSSHTQNRNQVNHIPRARGNVKFVMKGIICL